MPQVFNIYCDESCHLEHDRQQVMVLGAIWCPLEETIVRQYITGIDRQIDQLVYELYGLTDKEIEIVNEAAEGK